jgi:hypothetical protein
VSGPQGEECRKCYFFAPNETYPASNGVCHHVAAWWCGADTVDAATSPEQWCSAFEVHPDQKPDRLAPVNHQEEEECFSCEDCGDRVKADEDGCCASCGADCGTGTVRSGRLDEAGMVEES